MGRQENSARSICRFGGTTLDAAVYSMFGTPTVRVSAPPNVAPTRFLATRSALGVVDLFPRAGIP
eukprot:10381572-Prorocentrum_lima.AAC.1